MIPLPLPPETLLAAAAIIALAYGVFGLTGFGAGIIALPLLAQLMPIRQAVPMILLLDLLAGGLLGLRQRRHVERAEMTRLMPFAAAGMLLGVTLLVQAPQRALLGLLGVFTLAVTAWTLLQRVPTTPISTRWAVPAGAVGGVFTALFGTGGPLYTAYLARRIHDKHRLRATVGTLIFFTAIARLGLFALMGLYAQQGLLWTAALMVPCALLGLAAGNRVHARLPTARVMQAVWALLALSGSGLIVRALAGS
jgi:uncharacterized membrane protein YfcA